MRFRFLAFLPITLVALTLANPTQAQGSVSFGFGRVGCNSGWGVGISLPLCAPRACWVPGHYEYVATQVWVSGCCRHVWVEPVYDGCVDPCGNVTRVLVRAGYYQVVQDPGHYETRYVQVWVPGHYR